MRYLLLLSSLYTVLQCFTAFAGNSFISKNYGHKFPTGYIYVERELRSKNIPYTAVRTDIPLPEEFDLRNDPLGYMPIQDQACGDCWDFSIIATVESALRLNGTYPGKLAENYLKACSQYDCGGGNFDALDYMVGPKGAPLASAWPYISGNPSCKKLAVSGSILEWSYIGASNRSPTVDEIKTAIIQNHQEVSVDVAATGSFMNYGSGIYSGRASGINHMTNIAGWGKGYWIMRNSWGTSWGENGWMRITWGSNSIADTAAFVKVVEVPKAPVTFAMENAQVALSVTVQPTAKYTVDQAKAMIQSAMDTLGR